MPPLEQRRVSRDLHAQIGGPVSETTLLTLNAALVAAADVFPPSSTLPGRERRRPTISVPMSRKNSAPCSTAARQSNSSSGHPVTLLKRHRRRWKGPFDAVFRRNVMIYFDTPTKTRPARCFSDLLAPGGWLYIGHSETILDQKTAFRLRDATIYQKGS